MTTFVDAVTISGVKAISGTVNLDLRSPLVVVYAPNGTGKTSIWHAISAVIADFREEHLQCRVEGAQTLNIIAKIRTRDVNRPGFRRHLAAINYGLSGGGYEREAIHR